VDLSAFAGRSADKATLEAMTDVIMSDITALLETLRGEKAPAQRWDPSAHQQSSHGRFEERGSSATKPQTKNLNDAGTTEKGDLP
jgi:1-acyl-sn-glycerol-3-phosphate acyltransferase